MNTSNPQKPNKPTLFVDSDIADLASFSAKVAEGGYGSKYGNLNLTHYYHAFKEWAIDKSIRKRDWVATARHYIHCSLKFL